MTDTFSPSCDGSMQYDEDGSWVSLEDYLDLKKELDDCKPWLKEGQTPAQRLEKNHKETLGLLKLLELEKRKAG